MTIFVKGIRRPRGDEVEVEQHARSIQTVTVTTDPNTFTAQHDFDLKQITVAQYVLTVVALDGDGETFGEADGELGVALGPLKISLDGVKWGATSSLIVNLNEVNSVDQADTIGQFLIGGIVTPRYLQVPVGIFVSPFGNDYAGANHPTATMRFDVTYL